MQETSLKETKNKRFLATNLLELREKQFFFLVDLFEVTPLDLFGRARNEYEDGTCSKV